MRVQFLPSALARYNDWFCAVNFPVWESAVAAGKVDTQAVDVICETPTYPDCQWTIRGDLDAAFGQGFSEKVIRALLNVSALELLASFPRKGFIPATNSDYEPIRTVGKPVGLLD